MNGLAYTLFPTYFRRGLQFCERNVNVTSQVPLVIEKVYLYISTYVSESLVFLSNFSASRLNAFHVLHTLIG